MKNMKQLILKTACALLLAGNPVSLPADEPSQGKTAHSADFERMKTLVGAWKGMTDMGQGPVELTVEYRLLAGGKVLEERIFPGTDNEMVTMYFEKNGKLGLTHYCVLGNRPGMLLKTSDTTTLQFEFDKTCGVDPVSEDHMNALTIRFDGPDAITTTCNAVINGKAVEGKATTLKRVRS